MATEVPISDYRANLKAWHERVRAGEDLLVTEHGRPVVRVTSPKAEAIMDRLAREGLLTPGRMPRRPASDFPKFRSAGGIQDILDEHRNR